MSKYIRTKDGRISYLSSEPNEEITNYEIVTSKGTLTYRREDEVIKVADTIEELCDEFVDIDNHDYYKITRANGKVYVLSKTKRFIGHYDTRLKEIGQIMGAIWTEWGLKYVAKMNEKGELELL